MNGGRNEKDEPDGPRDAFIDHRPDPFGGGETSEGEVTGSSDQTFGDLGSWDALWQSDPPPVPRPADPDLGGDGRDGAGSRGPWAWLRRMRKVPAAP